MVHTTRHGVCAMLPDRDSTLARLCDESVERWRVPDHLAHRASAAVRRRIEWDDSQPDRSCSRAEGYFWAALRGMVLRSRNQELASVKARFALATIIEDLQMHGMAPQTVRDTVHEAYADLLQASGMSQEEFDIAC